MTGCPFVAARRPGNGEPALEDVVVQNAFRVLLGVIGHEAVDEGKRCWLYQDACEGAIEEERILRLLGIEPDGAEFGESAN